MLPTTKAVIAAAHPEPSQSKMTIGTNQIAASAVLRTGPSTSGVLLSRLMKRQNQTVAEHTTNTKATRKDADRISSSQESVPCPGSRQSRQATATAISNPQDGASRFGRGRGADVSGAANSVVKTALPLKRRHPAMVDVSGNKRRSPGNFDTRTEVIVPAPP